MLANVGLFICSAFLVYDTTKDSAKITTCGPKTNFHLYMRLGLIMGVTWISGLLAAFLNVEAVW